MKDVVWLVICGAGSDSGAWQIEDGKHGIGRGGECDIHLSHRTVSRRHVMLVKEGKNLSIHDLGSRNGTFVDGKRVRDAKIKIGTSLRLGDVIMELLDHQPSQLTLENWEEDTDPPRGHADGPCDGVTFAPERQQVLCLLLQGFTEKQIATQFDLNKHTVHWHVKGIYKRYRVHSRAQLAHRCAG